MSFGNVFVSMLAPPLEVPLQLSGGSIGVSSIIGSLHGYMCKAINTLQYGIDKRKVIAFVAGSKRHTMPQSILRQFQLSTFHFCRARS